MIMTSICPQQLWQEQREGFSNWSKALASRITPTASRDQLQAPTKVSQDSLEEPAKVSQDPVEAEATPQVASQVKVQSMLPQVRVTPQPKPRADGTLMWLASVSLLTLACILGFADAADAGAEEPLPHFLEPIPNKTVVVGRDVILPCSVDNLKGFKVAWIFVETQTILTIHHTIITKNPRFTLARNDHKHWYLKISDVRPSDRGMYMCQVNSDPMMSQTGFLDVQVPPDIIDEESSSEVVVKEGQDVTLECRARGSPKPVISWKREDGSRIDVNNGINLKVTDSEVLHIPTVSRLHMGAYLCIASNDVPPSVSKRITLKVQCK
nr:neurotrimin-like isoform X1 [Cherax quadricarinatus]XP_053641190.1 neurotrimin-like isoform X1 [Cherax quadricarinatus]